MEIRSQSDEGSWDAFVAARPESQFLQSWVWGTFQISAGNDVLRFAVTEGENIVGVAQCVLQRHPMGIRSLNVYRGPIVDQTLSPNAFQECFRRLIEAVTNAGRDHGVTYAHWEPHFAPNAPEDVMTKESKGWVRADSNQPKDSLLVRLPAELSRLHEKTRYNIRLAEKKGVIVEQGTTPEFLQHFLQLTRITEKRDGIRLHTDAYYKSMVEVLGEKGRGTLFVAFHDGTPLAANIVVSFGDTVTYLHGASSNEQRNLMSPHLLQWKQIEWAMAQGKRWYDFWGIAPPFAEASGGSPHSWTGITRFKKGFGGEERHYADARNLPISQLKYKLIQLRRKLR